jgi:hypothetical protein
MRRRLMGRRLAYVRSRLTLVRWRARRLSWWRRRGVCRAARDRGILRPRSWGVVHPRCSLMRGRTRSVVIVRYVRSIGATGSGLTLVCVGRRTRCLVGRFRSRSVSPVVRHGRVTRSWSGSVVWPRDIVVGATRVRRSSMIRISSGRTLWWPWNVVVSRCLARIVGSWSIHRRNVCHRGVACSHHTGTVEGRWFGGRRDLRPPMIHRCQLVTVGERHLPMLVLDLGRSDMPLAQRSFLGCGRTRVNSTVAAVVADPVHRDVVNYRFVVDIVDVGHVDLIDSAVVIKIPAAPVSTFISVAGVAKTIVNAAIEAHRLTPVSGMPEEG